MGDALEYDIQEDTKTWKGVSGFNSIISNPPFQKTFNNKNGRVGGSSRWSMCVNNMISKVKDDGYLMFITPISWMTGSTNKQSGNILKGVFQKNTMLYMDIEKCKKYFGHKTYLDP